MPNDTEPRGWMQWLTEKQTLAETARNGPLLWLAGAVAAFVYAPVLFLAGVAAVVLYVLLRRAVPGLRRSPLSAAEQRFAADVKMIERSSLDPLEKRCAIERARQRLVREMDVLL